MLSYVTVCEVKTSLVLGDVKIPYLIKMETQTISQVLEGKLSLNVPELPEVPDITLQNSNFSFFNQMLLATMADEQTRDSLLG